MPATAIHDVVNRAFVASPQLAWHGSKLQKTPLYINGENPFTNREQLRTNNSGKILVQYVFAAM